MHPTSFEAVAYQGRHHPTVVRISDLYQQAITAYGVNDLSAIKNLLDQISTLVKKQLNIELSIRMIETSRLTKVFSSPYRISVEIPKHAAFNPLNTKAMELYQNGEVRVVDPTALTSGYLDYKNCKVHGYLSEIPFTMEFTTDVFDGRVNGEKLCAALFHELGHVWSILSMTNEATITSALCAGVVDFFQRYEDPDKRVQFTRAFLQGVDPKAQVTADPQELIAVAVSSLGPRFEKTTQLPFRPNELNELLADQFAVHWGLGVSMVQVMKELHLGNSYVGKLGLTGQWSGILSMTISIYSFPWKTFTKGAFLIVPLKFKFIISGVVVSVYLVVMTLATLIASSLSSLLSPHGRAPTLRERVLNVKREHIALLQQKVSDEERRALLDDITAIDEVYKEVKEWSNPVSQFFQELAGYISGKQRQANTVNSIAGRVNNPLHELAARLELL